MSFFHGDVLLELQIILPVWDLTDLKAQPDKLVPNVWLLLFAHIIHHYRYWDTGGVRKPGFQTIPHVCVAFLYVLPGDAEVSPLEHPCNVLGQVHIVLVCLISGRQLICRLLGFIQPCPFIGQTHSLLVDPPLSELYLQQPKQIRLDGLGDLNVHVWPGVRHAQSELGHIGADEDSFDCVDRPIGREAL